MVRSRRLAQAFLLQLWLLLPALAADVIAIDPGARDPELARVTIESCSEAHGPGLCYALGDAPAQPGWFARVIWEDAAQLRARIEIRRGARDAAPESVRVVEFSAADDAVQRHRAVGLIVASFVLAREREDAAEHGDLQPANAQPASSETASGGDEPADARRFAVAGVDLGVLAGPGLDRGPARFGLTLRGFVRPVDLPLAVTLALRGARRPGDTAVLWVSGAAGLLLRLEREALPLALEARAELVAERVQAQTQDPVTRKPDSGDAFRLGARLGLELHLALGAGLSLFAGGDTELLLPAVSVEVGGRGLGSDAAPGFTGLLGLRLAR